MLKLPVEGRQGDAPKFPLPKPTARERKLWSILWSTPQAAVWERLGWTLVVARYARQLAIAELPDAPAPSLNEVRQLEDRLGLTPLALMRLQWEIPADELASARVVSPVSVRDRISIAAT